jgi:hypothetical protein
VDPDKNLVYTRRKQRHFRVIEQPETDAEGVDVGEEDAEPPSSNSTELEKVAFPEGEWKTSLAKSPTFKEMKQHISKSDKRHP